MIPVEAVGDEGYTSSPSQNSLTESPNGSCEPLFPNYEDIHVVSVTLVDQRTRTAAQIEQKQQKRGRGFGGHKKRDVKWRSRSQHDMSFECHGQVTASNHRKVRIPPMPKSCDLMALNQKFYKNVPSKQPELSKEEKNANLIAGMRNEVVFQRAPLIPPRPLPSMVHFLGFTEDGTAMITFMDEKNKAVFERNQEKIEMWFGHNRFYKLDTRILKEDVVKGRIVLVSIPWRDGSHWNMRAIISDFNDKWIIVDGVDHWIPDCKLSYDNVFYQLNECNFSPFQIQEVHLEGLEKYEGSPVLRFMIKRAYRAMYEWAKEERLKVPDYMILKKIQKGKDGYNVQLSFPDGFLDGLSLNKIIVEGMRNFDPFVDYIVTA